MDDLRPAECAQAYLDVAGELRKRISGMDEALEHLFVAMVAGGHVLLEGNPGLGKTLTARSFAEAVGGEFGRIQFTPDLMPADIIGTTVYVPETREFSVKKGPVFTNVLLADEINRSPARTQSALLQVMQEKRVTLNGEDHRLDEFLCVATQNPIEMEGTYPLPEAQLDRFFFKLSVGYPSSGDELEMLGRFRDGVLRWEESAGIESKVTLDHIKSLRRCAGSVAVEDSVMGYIADIVRKTRDRRGIEFGASPRAGIALLLACRVKAALKGRDFAIPDDVKELALPALRHRVILLPDAELSGETADDHITEILRDTEVPR